jgi:hypothetical protein
MKPRALFGLLVPAIIAAGCIKSELPDPPRTARVESDIRYAVAKYAFDHNGSAGQRNVGYFFLSVNDNPPEQAFLDRFKDESPTVLSVEWASRDEERSVIHKDDKQPGLIFHLDSIKWIDGKKVEVSWGYSEGPLSASGNFATVEYLNGEWVVTSDEMDWVS